jgi:hypothetical protein
MSGKQTTTTIGPQLVIAHRLGQVTSASEDAEQAGD